jgi:hypothetical protein
MSKDRIPNPAFILLFIFFSAVCLGQNNLILSAERFGIVADAKRDNGVWTGTDNSPALNAYAAYCRKNGLTMFLPKGNYGVSSTVWLTNPEMDGLKQSTLTLVGSNRGAYMGQLYSANICVLKDFKQGRMVTVQKKESSIQEPYLVPVLGISNGRQVHVEGIGILGSKKEDFICGIAIGKVSQITSVRHCDISNTYAGVVFPGLRDSPVESVIEGNNDLLVVEQSTFNNAYNIVCAGTQPFACEYRNSVFICTRSVFTGNLITNFYGQSRGSHKFSSNLFGTQSASKDVETVYFDIAFNSLTIDSCHFETGTEASIPEVLIRAYPKGGVSRRSERLSFTNNFVNFWNVKKNPSKAHPLFDTMVGNRMIIQGNSFVLGTATRIKAFGAVLIGNVFELRGPSNLEITADEHILAGVAGSIEAGLYDFDHFIRNDSDVDISLSSGQKLKQGVDYKVQKNSNAFEITNAGKAKIDLAKTTKVLVSYRANDAGRIGFECWGRNTFNPPDGWRSANLTLLANKLIYQTDKGTPAEKELVVKAGIGRK